MADFGEGGKNYNYQLENRCIYCGRWAKEDQQFALDFESDKVCPAHEKWIKGNYRQRIINTLDT